MTPTEQVLYKRYNNIGEADVDMNLVVPSQYKLADKIKAADTPTTQPRAEPIWLDQEDSEDRDRGGQGHLHQIWCQGGYGCQVQINSGPNYTVQHYSIRLRSQAKIPGPCQMRQSKPRVHMANHSRQK